MRVSALALLLAATPAAAQSTSDLFPMSWHSRPAREIVRYELVLAGCPAMKPGPRAGVLWQLLRQAYIATPPDEPGIRAWIRREVAKHRQERPPAQGWCEAGKDRYGETGRAVRNAVVMRDGSTTTRACVLDGSCSAADTIDVWLY